MIYILLITNIIVLVVIKELLWRMRMNNRIIKIDTNELRTNLTRYLKNNQGDTIYITRYNELVAEIKVYNNNTKGR